MKKLPLSLDRFAGLELDLHPLEAATREDRYTASTATNVTIDQITREVKRSRGSSAWINAVPSSGQVPLGIIEYVYQDQRRKYIVRYPSGFYLVDATFSSFTSMGTSVSTLPGSAIGGNQAMQVPTAAQIGRHLVICDGMGSYYWDGESNNLASTRTMEPPLAWGNNGTRPKMAATTGGTLLANHNYSVQMTFYSSTTGHSPPLPCGTIRTGATTPAFNLSTGYGSAASTPANGYDGEGGGKAAPPNGATHIYVWVQGHITDTSSPNYKKYFQFATLAIDDGTAGDELVVSVTTPATSIALPDFQGAPPGCAFVCSHVGRAFYTASPAWPARVWYSEPGNPLNLRATSWFDVDVFGDPVVGLVSFPNTATQMLGILKKRSAWTLSGYDDDSFLAGLIRVDGENGCIAPHSIRQKNDTAYYCGTGGIYAWTQGGKPTLISQGIQTEYLAAIRGAS